MTPDPTTPPDQHPTTPPAPDLDGSSGADFIERVVGSRLLHRGRYLTFRVDTIERADGSRSTREIADHPGAVAILAIDPDDCILLVRQFRVAAGQALLEIPAGTLDVAQDGSTEDPDLAAPRELEEETGMRAGSWQHVARFYTAPGFTSELMHLYLATDLRPADGERLTPDDDEHLLLERMPWRDAVAAAERGGFLDGKTLVALLWLARQRATSR